MVADGRKLLVLEQLLDASIIGGITCRRAAYIHGTDPLDGDAICGIDSIDILDDAPPCAVIAHDPSYIRTGLAKLSDVVCVTILGKKGLERAIEGEHEALVELILLEGLHIWGGGEKIGLDDADDADVRVQGCLDAELQVRPDQPAATVDHDTKLCVAGAGVEAQMYGGGMRGKVAWDA